ncbi:MAG: hypothetical protein LQ352_004899, partial [Teloschistes flavicans]
MSLPRPFILPNSIFNMTLYSRLLHLWFSPLPPNASSAAQIQTSRWFGMGTPSEKASFDAECASVALPALESISSSNFPLPPFQNTEHDQQSNYKAIAEPFLSQFNVETHQQTNYQTIAEPFLSQCNTAPDTDAEKEVRNAETALGLVLLLDQLPRNIFRAQQNAIYTHYDRISRAVAHAIYALNLDTPSSSHVPWKDSPVWQAWFYLPLMHSEALSDHNLFDEKMAAMRARAEGRGDEEAVG